MLIDWETVFDEKHPIPGASEAELQQFVAEVSRPMSALEIRAVHATQTNPFPESDPLYSAWRAIDATKWVIPDRPLPQTYLSFLRWSNGGEFQTGDRCFQYFPALDSQHGVRAMMLAYHIPEYMPGAVPFAFDGCGTFYLFDMREASATGEFPVVRAHSGDLSWDPDSSEMIAESFESVCRNAIMLRTISYHFVGLVKRS